MTGIAYSIFNEVSADYNTTKQLFTFLRSLELSLNVRFAIDSQWACFRNGLLKGALSGANSLRKFHLRTSADTADNTSTPLTEKDFMPMGQIFPVESWPYLRECAIGHLVVHSDDLVGLLNRLPKTVKVVQLDTLRFTQ